MASEPNRRGGARGGGDGAGAGADVVTADEVRCPGGISYPRIIEQFGCEVLDADLAARLGGRVPHAFLRRGVFFAHRGLRGLLGAGGGGCYLYTGRGPSAGMHVGHLLPFLFTAALQRELRCPVVVQLSDDEKFLKKSLPLGEVARLALDNARDIMACGLDPRRTFIFTNFAFVGELYPTVCRLQSALRVGQVCHAFGVQPSDPVGRAAYPAMQMAPAFHASMRAVLPTGQRQCLIPSGVDQDPYFRLLRDVAPKLKEAKPAAVYSTFVPSLRDRSGKMSASLPKDARPGQRNPGTIYLSDTDDEVAAKLKGALSGSGGTAADHARVGGDPDRDVALDLLRTFHGLACEPGCDAGGPPPAPACRRCSANADAEVAGLRAGFAAGAVSAEQTKAAATAVLVRLLQRHRAARARVTDAVLREVMRVRSIE